MQTRPEFTEPVHTPEKHKDFVNNYKTGKSLLPSRRQSGHSSRPSDCLTSLPVPSTVADPPLIFCREMLATPGPYLLDVMVPHVQHVLPMIPGGASFKEVITTGDGTVEY